ncbi:hypothetical protein MHI37_22805 [Paenibacillus sp. FSL H8-0548]
MQQKQLSRIAISAQLFFFFDLEHKKRRLLLYDIKHPLQLE